MKDTQSLATILNLAYIYLNYGKTKRAIDYLLIANRLAPQHLHVMKMQISAFRDIKAYPQALTLIEQLLPREDVSDLDRITLLLMKSLCLQGDNQDDEAKYYFSQYVEQRKAFAKKKFWEKMTLKGKKKSLDTYNAKEDLDQFIKKTGSH